MRLARPDVADLLYSMPAFIVEEDEAGSTCNEFSRGEVTDMMLLPPLPTAGAHAVEVPSKLARKSGQKRPLITRHSASYVEPPHRPAAAITRASANAALIAFGDKPSSHAGPSTPASTSPAAAAASPSIAPSSPPAASSAARHPSLNTPSMASSVSSGGGGQGSRTAATGGFRGIAMPSMQILQRNSRSLEDKQSAEQHQQQQLVRQPRWRGATSAAAATIDEGLDRSSGSRQVPPDCTDPISVAHADPNGSFPSYFHRAASTPNGGQQVAPEPKKRRT